VLRVVGVERGDIVQLQHPVKFGNRLPVNAATPSA
jgi:hypothetical protein